MWRNISKAVYTWGSFGVIGDRSKNEMKYLVTLWSVITYIEHSNLVSDDLSKWTFDLHWQMKSREKYYRRLSTVWAPFFTSPWHLIVTNELYNAYYIDRKIYVFASSCFKDLIGVQGFKLTVSWLHILSTAKRIVWR